MIFWLLVNNRQLVYWALGVKEARQPLKLQERERYPQSLLKEHNVEQILVSKTKDEGSNPSAPASARWRNWLAQMPLKHKIPGSNPGRAVYLYAMALNKLLIEKEIGIGIFYIH